MKKTKLFLGLASVAVLAACGNNTAKEETTEVADVKKSPFENKVEHEGTPIQGGVLKAAIVSDSPFTGVFNWNFYTTSTDAEIMAFFDESLFAPDKNYELTDKGIGKLTYDLDNKTATVTIKEGVKWSDGQPLTIDDYIYSFEVLGHPKYDGVRFGDLENSIEGMEEYHAGKASTISGITKNSDYSATFKFKALSPSIKRSGGFWSYATPKHLFKDIPVDQQAASDAVRKNPVGLGPFRVTKIVSGESVTFEANEYYWRGKPKLDGVVAEVVNSANSPEEFKAGKYDLMTVLTTSSVYNSFKDINNGTLLGQWQNVISFLAFNMGTWNAENSSFIPRENNKFQDVRVRQAMGYALDFDKFTKDFYDNLRIRANSLITPNFSNFYDANAAGFDYQPEKAKQLLDEAGLKDVDGDGFREDAQGKPLTINFALSSGGDADTQAAQLVKWWKEVGLRVELTSGRPIDFNALLPLLKSNDPSVDIYFAAYGLGHDPNPDSTWGVNSWNRTRYTSEKLANVLKPFNSVEAFDTEKLVAAYKEFQKVSIEEAFAIPANYRLRIQAVNKRVKAYDIRLGSETDGAYLHKLQLTADAPVANK